MLRRIVEGGRRDAPISVGRITVLDPCANIDVAEMGRLIPSGIIRPPGGQLPTHPIDHEIAAARVRTELKIALEKKKAEKRRKAVADATLTPQAARKVTRTVKIPQRYQQNDPPVPSVGRPLRSSVVNGMCCSSS